MEQRTFNIRIVTKAIMGVGRTDMYALASKEPFCHDGVIALKPITKQTPPHMR